MSITKCQNIEKSLPGGCKKVRAGKDVFLKRQVVWKKKLPDLRNHHVAIPGEQFWRLRRCSLMSNEMLLKGAGRGAGVFREGRTPAACAGAGMPGTGAP